MLLTESFNICCYSCCECTGLCSDSCDRLCGMQDPSPETQQNLPALLLHNPAHQSQPIVLVNKKSRNTKAVYIVLIPFGDCGDLVLRLYVSIAPAPAAANNFSVLISLLVSRLLNL